MDKELAQVREVLRASGHRPVTKQALAALDTIEKTLEGHRICEENSDARIQELEEKVRRMAATHLAQESQMQDHIQELEAALRDVMNVGDRAAVKVARRALQGGQA